MSKLEVNNLVEYVIYCSFQKKEKYFQAVQLSYALILKARLCQNEVLRPFGMTWTLKVIEIQIGKQF